MTDRHNGLCAGSLILLIGEGSTLGGLYSKQWKVCSGDELNADAFWIISVGDRKILVAYSRHLLKRFVMVAKRSELGIRPKLRGLQSLLRVLVFNEELCEPVGVFIRHRLQE